MKTLEIPDVLLDNVIITTNYFISTYDNNYVKSVYLNSNYLDVVESLNKKNINYSNEEPNKKRLLHELQKYSKVNADNSIKTKKPKINY